MKLLIIICLFGSSLSYAGSMYQCKNENGQTSFQDRPCEGETVKVSESTNGFKNEGYKNEMIKALSKMTGKSESELNDPKIRQAAEGLAAVDAGKSYAFTKIYGVSAKYCGSDVKNALANYESKASDIIALGKYYYSNGIHISVGNKKLSHSGQELTQGLNGMLTKLDNEHKTASKVKLNAKCKEAAQALKSLAMVYGS